MGFYRTHILPRLVHIACSQKANRLQRQKVVPAAKGRVLEIGIGSGLNLPFYDSTKVEYIWGLDPSPEMWELAKSAINHASLEINFLEGAAEEIPLKDRSADTVVCTYTLCTIPDVVSALLEMGRVLKPEGTLLFCEHGSAPDDNVVKWQNRLNPVWKKVAGGCHLNRRIPALLEETGFKIQNLDTMYIPGWKPGSFNYWGSATVK